MGLNINQPLFFPGEFHTKGCVWQHTFLITGGKRGLSIALIYYCVLNLMHFCSQGISTRETGNYCYSRLSWRWVKEKRSIMFISESFQIFL